VQICKSCLSGASIGIISLTEISGSHVSIQLVFRTIGYSGADIRNIINEAGIMAVS
jgi:ATP-dependent 26S proteasome regulatory subunit